MSEIKIDENEVFDVGFTESILPHILLRMKARDYIRKSDSLLIEANDLTKLSNLYRRQSEKYEIAAEKIEATK